MDFTMPDVTTPLNKQVKKENLIIDKVYDPFLSKFFGKKGIIISSLSELNKTIINQFSKLLEIIGKTSEEVDEKNKRDKKNELPPGEKKKTSWIRDKWQKVIKSNFFQKTLGFLKSLASVNMITQILTFLVLLRMGIFQRFIPFIISVIGDAILSLIGFLPSLVKLFWKMLTETIPKILKEIFRSIFKMLGIENETLLKFADLVAQWLPLLVAGAWIIATVMPMISAVAAVISFLTSIIVPIISAVGTAISLLASPIILIVASVVALIALVYIFREEIWGFITKMGNIFSDFFVTLKNDFYTMLIEPIGSFFLSIGLAIYDYIFKPFINLFSNIKQNILDIISNVIINFNKIKKPVINIINTVFNILKNIINKFLGVVNIIFNAFKKGFNMVVGWFVSTFVNPIKNLFTTISALAAPVLTKLSPLIKGISSIFDTIGNKVNSVLTSISETISELFAWFEGAGAFGGVDWTYNIESEERSKYTSAKVKFDENVYVKAAKAGLKEDVAKTEVEAAGLKFESGKYTELLKIKAENKDADLASILAAQSAGILKHLDNFKDTQENRITISGLTGFLTNNTGTAQKMVK